MRYSLLFLSAYVAERKTWDRREDIDLEEPTPLLKPKYISVTPKEKQQLITNPFKSTSDPSRRLTTTEVTNEKENKNRKTCQRITAWSRDVPKSGPKDTVNWLARTWHT